MPFVHRFHQGVTGLYVQCLLILRYDLQFSLQYDTRINEWMFVAGQHRARFNFEPFDGDFRLTPWIIGQGASIPAFGCLRQDLDLNGLRLLRKNMSREYEGQAADARYRIHEHVTPIGN